MSAPTRRRRPRAGWAATSVGLALLGALLIWSGLSGSSDRGSALAPTATEQSTPAASASTSRSPSPSPTAGATRPRHRPTAPSAESDVRDQVTGRVLPESDPVAVAIPRIAVRSRLVDLGLDGDGAMEVPRDPALAGWFSRGAAPGALGPAVIAGHVTWNGTRGVFHRLGTLRRGDRVSVTRQDGRTAVFTVTRVAQYSKSQFPSRAVYGAIDHAGLRLVTCGGTYDSTANRYLDNVVVFARLQGVRGPRD